VTDAVGASRAFTGVVVARIQSDLGFRVQGKILERLVDTGQREAIVQLPETLRPAVGSEAQARLYGTGQQHVAAKLRLLSDAADPVTRTFEARYVLEGALAGAPLGSTMTLHIAEGKTPRQMLQVPLPH
jgi:multidrug efflux pump subunit AcrA (membrane-fusion protein)